MMQLLWCGDFFNICLKWHIDQNCGSDCFCYVSNDILLKAASQENIVKVANSGTLKLLNIYLQQFSTNPGSYCISTKCEKV